MYSLLVYMVKSIQRLTNSMLKNCVVIYFFCNAFLYSRVLAVDDVESDEVVRKRLLTDYDKSLPPMLYGQTAISMYFYFIRTRGLDEKKGEFITESAIVLYWKDERFKLDPSVDRVMPMPLNDIWVPSIYIVNSIEKEEITLLDTPMLHSARLFWIPRYTFRTACKPNLKYFPFDTQVCELIIATGTKEGDYLEFNITDKRKQYINKDFSAFTPTYFIENPQWSLQNIEYKKKNMTVYSDSIRQVITHTFTVTRSMPLLPLAILTPCLCCVFLLLTTFWMEAGSNLRAGINITSTLVSSSSLFTLGKILPASGSSTPVIVEYVSITLMLSAVSSIQTMMTSIVIRCEKRPPISYATIISKIPTICLMLLRIAAEEKTNFQLEEKFLFSDLSDPETRNVPEAEDSPTSTAVNQSPESVLSLWQKYVVLWDRIMFYILGVFILLFILSVIINE